MDGGAWEWLGVAAVWIRSCGSVEICLEQRRLPPDVMACSEVE